MVVAARDCVAGGRAIDKSCSPGQKNNWPAWTGYDEWT